MEPALVQNGAALMYYRVGSFIKEKLLYITKRLVVLNSGSFFITNWGTYHKLRRGEGV